MKKVCILSVRWTFVVVGSCALLACTDTSIDTTTPSPTSVAAVSDTSPVAGPSIIAPHQQRVGDPAVGRDKLLAADYVDCGLPLRVYRELGLDQAGPSLPGRVGASSDLPYFNNLVVDERGQEVVANNCLTCHATVLNGEVVIGLGNEFLDFTDDPSRLVESAGLLVRGDAETRVWQKFADRIAAIAPYTVAETVGVNVANNLTAALMTHFDPVTMTWSDNPLIAPPDTVPLPVSVPPWWRMKKKHAMFYQGQWRGDHARIMITAAMLCADSVEDLERADVYAPDVRAYIASLEPPAYPYETKPSLVETGKEIFEATCSGCHGTYGQNAQYPNLLIPLDSVGTDPALALQAGDDYQRFNEWFEKSWFYRDTDIVSFPGYAPPPLDGIWATAPFLHNGSVPDLQSLLNSIERPQRWRMQEPRSFDQVRVGWAVQAFQNGEPVDNSGVEVPERFIYDTGRAGYGNSGHTYGDTLDPAERRAVIEYLKTL